MSKKRFTLGNRKLPKTTAIFNLPEIETCPGRTVLCEKICYATKASRFYPNVAPHRQSNYEWIKHGLKTLGWLSFSLDVGEEIKKLPASVTHVRIHESGDFFSSDYLTMWFAVAKDHPDLTFYAYSRSYFEVMDACIHWDLGRLPANFILLASLDATTPHLIKASIQDRYDYTGTIKTHPDYKNYYTHANGAHMPWWNHTMEIVQKGKISNCIQDCTKCNMCFNPSLKDRKLKLKVEAH